MGVFLFISGTEIIFIVLIVVMLFGADKVPEIARGLGKGLRQLRDITNDVKREITQADKVKGLDTGVVKDLKKEIHRVEEEIQDIGNSVKRNTKL